MTSYLTWDRIENTDFSETKINSLYNEGYLFTRIGKGIMDQTRSARIDLNKFNLSSENKRILKKMENARMEIKPIPFLDYEWSVHKMGKDFYEKKFGPGIFSAQKIKELITDKEKSNFNRLFVFLINDKPAGYCITLETNDILHYSYPFYQLSLPVGMGMMTKAVAWAKEKNKKYVYLGSAQRPTDVYKFQFEGMEWFDGKQWINDINKLKEILKK